jgi:hypothetical protein
MDMGLQDPAAIQDGRDFPVQALTAPKGMGREKFFQSRAFPGFFKRMFLSKESLIAHNFKARNKPRLPAHFPFS